MIFMSTTLRRTVVSRRTSLERFSRETFTWEQVEWTSLLLQCTLLTRTRQADVIKHGHHWTWLDKLDVTFWREKIVDIPSGMEHNLTKRWLDWIPNYPERICRDKTKIWHHYWQNINWGTSWCQNPGVKCLRQPVTHVLWIKYMQKGDVSYLSMKEKRGCGSKTCEKKRRS